MLLTLIYTGSLIIFHLVNTTLKTSKKADMGSIGMHDLQFNGLNGSANGDAHNAPYQIIEELSRLARKIRTIVIDWLRCQCDQFRPRG